MLETLSIKNFVIVDQLELSFKKGFSAFTGETGAGKSILIDALSICLGQRGDISLIRKRKEKADISAMFNICLLYTSPSPRDRTRSRMPSSA